MTRGFYDQLGVEPSAPTDVIRQAYLRLVTQFRRRRKVLVERGGDPDRLELARTQADESYAVLSDPERRRRYDAMLAMLDTGIPNSEDALWDQVEGAVVSAGVSAAVDLLLHTTDLALQAFPAPPGPAFCEPEPEPLLRSVVVAMPGVDTSAPNPNEGPALRVVDGSGTGAPVIMMPTPTASTVAGAPAAVRLVESPPEPELPPGPPGLFIRMGPTGPMLHAVRELLGLTLDDLSEQTRIAVRFLQAIEEEAFDRLPSATFVRGYVREVATLMELDEDEVVEGYMERFHGAR